MHSRINQPKPTCIWTGWRLQVTQKTILNTQHNNHSHQGEGDPKRRVQQYSLPNPELMLLLDPSLIPDPCLTAVLEKKEPQMIFTWPFIQCVKLRMMYTDDARIASSNIIHHHEPQAWETSGGKTGHTHKPQVHKGHTMKFKNLDPQAIGQWAAHDI